MINKRFCHNCGNEIPTGSKFCRFCGNQQNDLEETKSTSNNDGYFVSHWKLLLSILGPAFLQSVLYGVFIAIALFVIEIVAAFFGYCITARGQECSETGAEIIYIPIALGGFYFIYGAFSVLKRILIVIAQSQELKIIFGLLQRPKGLSEYITSRGIHTLFFPKYLFLIFTSLLLLLTQADLTTMLLTIGATLIITDLRFLKWLFIKQLKLDKYALETNENQ